MKKLRKKIRAGKWFDRSPIYSRRDPRYVRRVRARFAAKVIRHWAPFAGGEALAAIGLVGLMVGGVAVVLLFTLAL